jgi:two-component system, NarL family, nitrate/nitrite response regulator NarL
MQLLLVDDHPLFGVGFAHALQQARHGLRVKTALTLTEGLAWAEAALPDLVLIDYRLRSSDGLDGLAGLRRFAQQLPLVPRLLISGDEDAVLAQRARTAGASGCLGKSLPIERLLQAIDTVLDGGECFPSRPGAPAPTARQLEVLGLLGQGKLNKQIADELGIAERTVKLHLTALFELLQARNRTQLLARAKDTGLL